MCRIVIDLLIIAAGVAAFVAYTLERRKVRQEISRLRTQLARCYAKDWYF
jgi:hypothetical protein